MGLKKIKNSLLYFSLFGIAVILSYIIPSLRQDEKVSLEKSNPLSIPEASADVPTQAYTGIGGGWDSQSYPCYTSLGGLCWEGSDGGDGDGE